MSVLQVLQKMVKWLALQYESCILVHKMFAIILVTIYLDEAPSAITILALFPENKNAVVTKLEFRENKKCNSDKIEIFSKIAKKKKKKKKKKKTPVIIFLGGAG
jgi:hypothetical protein